MSHLVCYTRRMIIKTDMKNKNEKANNLLLGAIYINATTGQPCRLVNIVSCQGVWLETFDGQGYGDLVKFEDCHYADIDEVQDFLQDLEVYTASEKSPSHKVMTPFGMMENHSTHPNAMRTAPTPREYYHGKEIVRDSDGSAVVGWYDDNEGNDIRCRD